MGMKYLWLIPMILQTAFAGVKSIIPSKTETPFFRIYEGVRIKADKELARVSVSHLVRDYSQNNSKSGWEVSLAWDSLDIPLSFYQDVRSQADATLTAITGDSYNSFGTAFHIGEGYVLTNQHVLSSSRTNTTECKNFQASTGNGEHRFKCEKVIYCEREADFCVIKLKKWRAGKMDPAALPKLPLLSERMPDRDALYAAIGNTGGEGLHYSRGRGIWRNSSRQFVFYAPVHSGNSGGPLLNEQGQVIAVVYAQGQYGVTEEGYNIAVPIEYIIGELQKHVPGHEVLKFFETE
jgi:S1-C subfamily serine protease